MGLSRRLRRWFAGSLAVCVLFTQLAVAAYACPQVRQESAEPPVAAAAAADPMAAMPDCHGMATDPAAAAGQDQPRQPTLCKAHCSNDAQTASRAAAPEFPSDAAAGPLLRVIEPVAVASWTAHASARSPVFGPPPPLPIYLALHVLRN